MLCRQIAAVARYLEIYFCCALSVENDFVVGVHDAHGHYIVFHEPFAVCAHEVDWELIAGIAIYGHGGRIAESHGPELGVGYLVDAGISDREPYPFAR